MFEYLQAARGGAAVTFEDLDPFLNCQLGDIARQLLSVLTINWEPASS